MVSAPYFVSIEGVFLINNNNFKSMIDKQYDTSSYICSNQIYLWPYAFGGTKSS